MLSLATACLLTLLAPPALPASARLPANPVLVERETFLMGTHLRGILAAPTAQAGFAALEAAFLEVRRFDSLLSSWRPDSEVGRLNRAPPGTPVEVPPQLLDLLGEAWAWSARTDQAFDPAVGALIDAWGLRGSGNLPACDSLDAARRASGSATFTLDARRGVVTRERAGAWISAGAFGKGAALRGARAVLVERGVSSALLDFGGQLLALGPGPDRSGWPVDVAHPAEREFGVAQLRLRDRSVATSGESERFVEVGGRHLGHILDPRSGRPVEAWGSVTVVAQDALVADILSTALFVMGPVAGSERAADLRDVGVLFLIDAAGGLRAWSNGAMGPWLVALNPEVEVIDDSRIREPRFPGRPAGEPPVMCGAEDRSGDSTKGATKR